ncbi:short-chain dehydrogenase/reductase [Streptomyces sp. NPDC004959]|uniref:short-chain dehydrogenase/reductase n=1 Tax=unclassified Streptomyces TaxID=2593676 RepID=UPI0004C9E9E5|nr:short-chain dehydrogenase/reductase [Streptomyces sp. NRRL F-5630]
MPPTSPLGGRTAVVTGAARGIGALLAHALAERGMRLALLGLEDEELRAVAAGLPGPAAAFSADVRDPEAVARAARQAEERFGPPSVVVANAGIAAGGPYLDGAVRTWRDVLDVNLGGSAVTAHAFLPGLLRTRGYYLQVTSLAALTPSPLLAAYCASKAGAEMLAHCLRTEYAPRGVGVGVAYFNWADTDMIRAADTTEALHALRSRLPGPAGATAPAAEVAARLARGIERRARSVYAQPWLRLARAGRALAPWAMGPLTSYLFGSAGPGAAGPATGPLGAGGRAARRTGGR